MQTYIPKKILNYYRPILYKENDTIISSGDLCCSCSSRSFRIEIVGVIKKRLFRNISLFETSDRTIRMKLYCTECENTLELFDSRTDGYDAQSEEKALTVEHSLEDLTWVICLKCHDNQFRVRVKFEHLPKSETDQIGIIDYRNAFQWLWIDLECSSCSRKYVNFLDIETG